MSGTQGFPTGATALVANLTAVGADGPGYLSVYPAGTARPIISDVNFRAGFSGVANMVVVELGSGDAIEIYNGSHGVVNVLVDVAGFDVGS